MSGINYLFAFRIIHTLGSKLYRFIIGSKQFKFVTKIELIALIQHSIPLFITAFHNCNNIRFGGLA